MTRTNAIGSGLASEYHGDRRTTPIVGYEDGRRLLGKGAIRGRRGSWPVIAAVLIAGAVALATIAAITAQAVYG